MSTPAESTSRRRARVVLGWLLGALCASLVGVVVHRTLPLLYPEEAERALPAPFCDLRAGPCTARFASGGSVRFAISPRDIPALKPLRLDVEVEGLVPARVEVDFAGADMNMGFNRVSLGPRGTGRYQGVGILPICVRHRMTWVAKVLLQTERGYLVAPFRFDALRPSKADH